MGIIVPSDVENYEMMVLLAMMEQAALLEAVGVLIEGMTASTRQYAIRSVTSTPNAASISDCTPRPRNRYCVGAG